MANINTTLDRLGLQEAGIMLPPSSFPDYYKLFIEHTIDQGYIHIDLTCYRYDIREGWLESKPIALLFDEIFQMEKKNNEQITETETNDRPQPDNS